MSERNKTQVLVFLPVPAATQIVDRLSENGYVAAAVSSLEELETALQSTSCSLVITTRPEIDVVRNIKPLPVLNIEIFFYSKPGSEMSEIEPRKFDSHAFLGRIGFMTEPRRTRTSIEVSAVTSSKTTWWAHPSISRLSRQIRSAWTSPQG